MEDRSKLSLSERALARLEYLRPRYPDQRALILPVLSMAQREFGWIDAPAMHYVAQLLDVPPIWVEEVATFYTMYNKRPTGRWHLQVCNNISCALMGSEVVLEHLAEKHGIKPGHTTDDGQFTLTCAECLGSCGTAPMMQVNDVYVENMSLADVDALIADLKARPDADPKADPQLFCGPGTGPSRTLPLDAPGLAAGTAVITPESAAH